MNLYRFKTFRTSYYFPNIGKNQEFLYGLYTPYGMVARVYWWLFRHVSLIRILNRVKVSDLNFPYVKIVSLCPNNSVLSLNMGTPGTEQKISMLGLEPDGKKFFAKYSEKPDAISLSRNEVKVLAELEGKGIAPDLYEFHENNRYIFFRTSYAGGESPRSLSLNKDIVDLAIKIGQYHLYDKNEGGLKTCLSHGDFTPWNMLVKEGAYRLIDWEMAAERPLGYDLFFFIYQTGRLFSPSEQIDNKLNANATYIDYYFNAFGIKDWRPYYDSFKLRIDNAK